MDVFKTGKTRSSAAHTVGGAMPELTHSLQKTAATPPFNNSSTDYFFSYDVPEHVVLAYALTNYNKPDYITATHHKKRSEHLNRIGCQKKLYNSSTIELCHQPTTPSRYSARGESPCVTLPII